MKQVPKFPCLPGYNFDQNIGRIKFNKSHVFDKIHNNVYYLLEKPEPEGFSRYPALHAWGEEPPCPAWLAYDSQRLKFKAYFEESVYGRKETYRIRYVDISFFLEDGTIKICEPAITNSGLEQGILVKRQRIPLPNPVHYRYFDILDLNVRMEPMIFGRVYKIIDCDDFTRKFLNGMGITVPDPLDPPKNPNYDYPKSSRVSKQRPEVPDKFFKFDGKILRFYGYWDDTDAPYGYIHDLEILYFLADDTMQVFDCLPVGRGSKSKITLVKRMKIPKFFEELEPPGNKDSKTLLNVLGDSGYYINDSSHSKKPSMGYYEETDFAIGAQLSIFGRRVIIADFDKFTQVFYRKKYGVNDFTPLERPENQIKTFPDAKDVPPYNGFGGYEDSLGNCFTIIPKRPKMSTDKAYYYENQENDRRILRFGAKMISGFSGNENRRFVLNVYLSDNTILIMEGASKKAARIKNVFQKRMRFQMPGQSVFSSEKPEYYEPRHFYVGATVILMSFKFYIETADEYTLSYMETHSKEFPKANKDLAMSKIREKLKTVGGDFVNKLTPIQNDNQPPIITYDNLKEAVLKNISNDITEHEIITIARHYHHCEKKEVCPREYLRGIVHTELIRNLFQTDDLKRLGEDVQNLDRHKTGYLTRQEVYTVLIANRIPLPKEVIELMLDRLHKNEEGKIDCNDLFKFVDTTLDPLPPALPVNIKALYWEKEDTPKDCKKINWATFLQDLNSKKPDGEEPKAICKNEFEKKAPKVICKKENEEEAPKVICKKGNEEEGTKTIIKNENKKGSGEVNEFGNEEELREIDEKENEEVMKKIEAMIKERVIKKKNT